MRYLGRAFISAIIICSIASFSFPGFAKNQCRITVVDQSFGNCVCNVDGRIVGTEQKNYGTCVNSCMQAASC